jgi:hypothetical protein
MNVVYPVVPQPMSNFTAAAMAMDSLAESPDWKDIEALAAGCRAAFNKLVANGIVERGQHEFAGALDNPSIREPAICAARKLKKALGHAGNILSEHPRELSCRRGLYGSLREALLSYGAL